MNGPYKQSGARSVHSLFIRNTIEVPSCLLVAFSTWIFAFSVYILAHSRDFETWVAGEEMITANGDFEIYYCLRGWQNCACCAWMIPMAPSLTLFIMDWRGAPINTTQDRKSIPFMICSSVHLRWFLMFPMTNTSLAETQHHSDTIFFPFLFVAKFFAVVSWRRCCYWWKLYLTSFVQHNYFNRMGTFVGKLLMKTVSKSSDEISANIAVLSLGMNKWIVRQHHWFPLWM